VLDQGKGSRYPIETTENEKNFVSNHMLNAFLRRREMLAGLVERLTKEPEYRQHYEDFVQALSHEEQPLGFGEAVERKRDIVHIHLIKVAEVIDGKTKHNHGNS
jgi:hypothetical protein